MPDLRRLRYLLAVAEERSFTRAAARLHVAQPALSRQVRLLEAEVGVELLHRTPEGVEVTEAGAVVLERAPAALAALDRLWAEVRHVGEGCRGALRIAHGSAVAYDTLPRIVREAARVLPHVELVTEVRTLADALSGLDSGDVDAALVRCAPAAEGVEARLVRRDRQGVMLAADHALAARGTLTLGDLADEVLSLHDRAEHPPHFDLVMGALRAAGVEPARRPAPMSFDPGHSQVATGEAVMIVGESTGGVLPASVRIVPLEPPLHVDISLLVRAEGRAPALDRLVALVDDLAARRGWHDDDARPAAVSAA